MKPNKITKPILLFVMIFFIPIYAENPSHTMDIWEIRAIPYFWMPSLDADSTVNGLSGSVELDSDDVIDDYLHFAAMGRVEAWKDPWGLMFDGVFMNLSTEGGFEGSSGAVAFDMDADVRLGMADFGLAYRLVESRFGQDDVQRLALEPYGGLRYAYLRQRIDMNVNIVGVGSAGQTLGTSEDWVEPFVGGRVIWDLNDKLSLNIRGDAGGFGIGSASDLLWQIIFGVDYKLSDNTSFNVGYRYVDLDYSRGSGSNEFGIDLQAKGPFVGLTIVF